MSKNSHYFSHDYNTRTDEKIKRLIRKHGLSGYGLFWAIVEDLYNNANALRTDYDSIAFDLRADVEMVKSVINDFDLFVVDGDYFGSTSIQRRLDERFKKSEKARQSATYRWDKDKDDANALRTQSDRNAIKESKGKKNKGNESKGDLTAQTSTDETAETETEGTAEAGKTGTTTQTTTPKPQTTSNLIHSVADLKASLMQNKTDLDALKMAMRRMCGGGDDIHLMALVDTYTGLFRSKNGETGRYKDYYGYVYSCFSNNRKLPAVAGVKTTETQVYTPSKKYKNL